DIASPTLLSRYDSKHALHARPLYYGTNMLLKLFTDETAPAKLLRGLVLRVSNNLPPLKKLITRQLTG
ncbi:FAD-dependent hydroxylase, partial [Bacillus stratosphericus]